MIIDFLTYYFTAKNAHGIHSPFVFDLYTNVYKSHKALQDFDKIENLRKELRKDTRSIDIQDFGAGSRVNASKNREISDIAKSALKSKFWSRFFYRLITHYNYQNVLELGTSLGITTTYLAKATPNGEVYTFEGCENTLKIASETFSKLGLSNIKTVSGNITETLPKALKNIDSLDFVLFDANHRYTPTLQYFEMCLEKINNETIFVFDDIYWSEEMKQAWREIKRHKAVSISVDFYDIGLVFFKDGLEKQDFVLK